MTIPAIAPPDNDDPEESVSSAADALVGVTVGVAEEDLDGLVVGLGVAVETVADAACSSVKISTP